MKKLLMWSALLMTGFAFYSCDDVIDNPVEDPAGIWNYSVSVTCPDFTGLFDANNDPVAYQVPKTLYVLNEQGTPLGTISTEAEPTVNTPATYSGTLKGALGGNNLVITTKIGADFAKQDGTIASAIENGIIQADTVAIKIYNANSQKVTTAAAKLKNLTSIGRFRFYGLVTKDEKEFTFSSKNFAIPGVEGNSFKITLDKAVDPTQPFYVAIGVNTDDKFDIQIDTDVPEKGYDLTGDIKEVAGWTTGIVYGFGSTDMEASKVDLAKYWTAYKAENENATYCSFTSNRKGAVITQSANETLPINLTVNADATLKELNIQYLYVAGTNEITLDGKTTVIYNKNYWASYALSVDHGAIKLTGKGSLDLYGKEYGINVGSTQYTDDEGTHNPKLIIGEGITVDAKGKNYYGAYVPSTLELEKGSTLNVSGPQRGVYLFSNGEFIVGDKATVNATAEDQDQSSYSYAGITLNSSSNKLIIGDEATIVATSKCRQGCGIYTDSSTGEISIGKKATVTATGGNVGYGIRTNSPLTIADEATVTASSGKSGYGIYIDGYNDVTIGKSVTITAESSEKITGSYPYSLYLYTSGNISIGDNATINANGKNNYCALYIRNYPTITLGDGAKIKAVIDGENAYTAMYMRDVTIKGKGTISAECLAQNAGAYIYGTVNIEGGSLDVIGGQNDNGIVIGGTLTLSKTFTQLKVTSGQTTDPICIYSSATNKEATLAELIGAGNADDFVDSGVKDGVRTITPAPAEE